MRTRRHRFVIGLFAFSLVLAACSSDNGGGTGATTGSPSGAKPGEGQVIKLLYSAPLTGDPSGAGRSGCDGAQLAAQDINSAGGLSKGPLAGATLSIKCVDDQFSTDVAATIANRYLSDPSIWSLMGFVTSGQAAAAGKVVAPYKLSVIGSNVTAQFLTDDADNIAVIPGRLDAIGYAMSDVCKSYFQGSTMANINPDFSYVDELEAGQKAAQAPLGVHLAYSGTYQYGTQDFSSLLTAAKAKNPDCIYTSDFPPISAQILLQARQAGMGQPFLDLCACGTAQASVDVAKSDYIGYIVAEMVPANPAPDSLLATVEGEWKSKFGTSLTSYPAWSYDGVLAVAYAIEAGATSREQILDYLPKVDGPGLTTEIHFNSDLRADKGASLTALEQTGPGVDDLEPIASYSLSVDGSVSQLSVADCSARPTCQANQT